MNQHLSHERISELLVEPQRGDEKAHIDACPACNAELEELRTAISAFGEAARNVSALKESRQARQSRWSPALERKHHWTSLPRVAWSFVAVLVLLVAVWVPIHKRSELRETTALNAANDEVLMQEIDSQVSRRVPAAMDPLAKLIADDDKTGTANSETNATGNGEKQ